MFVVKECTKCKEYKLLEEFPRDKRSISQYGKHTQCRVCMSKKTKEWVLNNKERSRKNNKLYSLNNKDKTNKHKKRWRDKNKSYNKDYYISNSDIIKTNTHEYKKNRRNNDFLFKLRCDISTSITGSIRRMGYTKRSKTHEILGCDYETFKLHIEKQFTKGMTWDNHGEWHLDHIYPVSLAKDEQHLIELNHYTNFQPLWAKDNLSKGNKIIDKQLFLL